MIRKVLIVGVITLLVLLAVSLLEVDEQGYYEHAIELSMGCEESWFCPLQPSLLEESLLSIQTGNMPLDIFLRNVAICLLGFLTSLPFVFFLKIIQNNLKKYLKRRLSWQYKIIDKFPSPKIEWSKIKHKLDPNTVKAALEDIKRSKISNSAFERLVQIIRNQEIGSNCSEDLSIIILAKLNERSKKIQYIEVKYDDKVYAFGESI